jgi:hypothetical protein
MSRYKGRASLKVIKSKFPHHVDVLVPEGGFGSRLNAMHDWHDARGIPAVRGQSRRENGRDYIRWCFADPAVAEAFASEFDELRTI